MQQIASTSAGTRGAATPAAFGRLAALEASTLPDSGELGASTSEALADPAALAPGAASMRSGTEVLAAEEDDTDDSLWLADLDSQVLQDQRAQPEKKDSQPSSPPASADPAQPLAALADPSTSAQPSLPLDHDVLGCEVSVEAGSGSRMHEPVQSGPECSEPSTSAKLPSTLLQKLSAAKQSLPFHATQQQKSPNRKAAKKPKTSTAAADHGQQTKGQKCRACLPMTGIGQHWHRLVVHLLICPPSHPCTSREIKATEAVVLTRKCIGSGLALAMDRPWQWSFGSGWALSKEPSKRYGWWTGSQAQRMLTAWFDSLAAELGGALQDQAKQQSEYSLKLEYMKQDLEKQKQTAHEALAASSPKA